MEERYLSLSEAADALDISERTAYRWIKSGKLRAYKPGRDYRIPEGAIREAIERSEVRPKAPASSQPSFNGLLEEERRRTVLEEIRESYREEREGVEHYLARWEQRWITTSAIPEEAVRESLVAARTFYPVLRGLSISELTEISMVLRIDGLTEEAKAESSLLPLVDRYWELGRKLTEAWNESSHEDPPIDFQARRELRLRRTG